MAKRKSKRPNLPEETLARARAELYGDDAVAPVVAAPAEGKKKGKSASPKQVAKISVSIEDLRTEYAYVIADLRSMGILAALLIIGLIVASLALV